MIARGKVPPQVAAKLLTWAEDVADRGLEVVRRVPGFHDEPLQGKRFGQLNKTWRAIYTVQHDVVRFVLVEEVTPHKY